VSELKVHIELTRFVQPEKIEIDANERAVNEKSQYCFFVCTTFDSFLNDFCYDSLTEHMWFRFYKMLFCRQRNNLTTTGRTLAYIFIIKKTDNGRCIHIFQLGNIFFAAKDVSA